MSAFDPITELLRPDPDCPAVRPDTVLVAVMHYERGDHLRLAIESIERNAPGMKVLIADDGSQDADTVALLHALAHRHTVVVNKAQNSAVYLRGLHANMNAVLGYAKEKGFPYVFFLQEDQQIVRPLDAAFFAEVDAAFRGNAALSQLIPVFFRAYLPNSLLTARYGIDPQQGFYYEKRPNYGVSDIGITSVQRLAAHGFRFLDDEGNSGTAALRLGLRIGIARNPVFMYTPWPRTTRDHPDNVSAFGLGVNPFQDMTEEDIRALCARSPEIFPVAERHLRTVSAHVRQPWWYTSLTPHSLSQYKAFLQQKAEEGEV